MEAAAAHLRELPERLRARGFERECERLRPLGEAYVLRRFGASLGRADAEDAVAEVVIRLHRQAAAGNAPANLRAAFFTAVRNAAIDQLRSRGARPTVPLEVVAEAPLASPGPAERAESGEAALRLREAMARMRPNYRKAIALRFGLGLTVPEIAERLGVSLPAAKKLVLRATAQARKRLAAVEGEGFCPEMRELARRAIFEREAAGLLGEEESRLLRAHLGHCGACRSFLAHLHEDLHELGCGLLFTALTGGRLGTLERLLGLLEGPGRAATALHGRVRLLGYRASAGLSSSGEGPGSGALAGGAQKIAAVCTVGVAGAASCLASGVVGPGIGLGGGPTPHPVPRAPAARVRRAGDRASGGHHLVATTPVLVTLPLAAQASATAPAPRGGGKEAGSGGSIGKADAAAAKKSPAQQTEAEFGFESRAQAAGSSGGEAAEAAPTTTTTAESEPTSESSATSSSASTSTSSAGSSAGSSGSGGSDFGGFEK